MSCCLTGLQHGVIKPSQPNGLPLEIPTIADKLKEVGYSTHMVGKWHIGYFKKEYMPTFRGFDSFYGYLNGAEDYWTHIRCGGDNFVPGFEHFCGIDLHNDTEVVRNQNGSYSARLFTSRVQDIVKNHDQSKPLFMYLPYQSVHAPLQAPQEYIDRYANIKDKKRRHFAGMVSVMDEAVKNVTDSFKKYGLWNNTIMIFSTDNGGPKGSANNWPLRGGKHTLWEGGVHGVGFVNSPLLKKSGYVNHGFMHISDWFPTMLSVAGGSTARLKLDGFNQWDTISMNATSPRKELLHNIDPMEPKRGKREHHGTFDQRQRAAIRVGDWKLITGDPGPGKWIPPPHMAQYISQPLLFEKSNKNLWLFNIKDDPTEHHDLSDQNPDMVKQLLDRLAYYESTAVKCRYPKPEKQSNPKLHDGAWGPWR